MIRNLKALGLALVAVFALAAVVASSASAQKITANGPVTLTASETGAAGSNDLTAFGLKVECPGSEYTGHTYNVTPHTTIPSGQTTATLTPHYKETNAEGLPNCTVSPGEFRATVDMNGCDYVVHLGVTTGGINGTYGVTFDVICPAGKEITLTIFEKTQSHLTTPFCTVHVPGAPSNQGLKGAHATDTGNGHIDISGTIEGIKLSQTEHGHPLLCPTKSTEAGKLNIDVTVKDTGGRAISISE